MKRRSTRVLCVLYSALAFVGVVVLVLISPFCVCGMLFVGSAVAHNHKLAEYEKQLRYLEHPPNTSCISLEKAVWGESTANGCDYFVGELRRYTGSTQDIVSFYQNGARSNRFYEDLAFLFFVGDDFPSVSLPGRFAEPSDWEISPSELQGPLYMIYFWTYGDSFFDYRCR